MCFKTSSPFRRTVLDAVNQNPFQIDLELLTDLDYGTPVLPLLGTLRTLHQESRNNGYGGASAGMKITPMPNQRKEAGPSSPLLGASCVKACSEELPLKPLYFVGRKAFL